MNKKSKTLQERNERIQKRFAEELAKTKQQEGRPKKRTIGSDGYLHHPRS